MREESFLEAGDDDHRELEALRAVHRHHQHACVLAADLFVGVGEQRQLIDEATK